MIDLNTYVAILLIMQLATTIFLTLIIRRQMKLNKRPIDNPRGRHFRRNLFLASITIVVTNVVPFVIDAMTLLIDTGRPPEMKLISFVYALSIHLEALLLSFFLWQIYRLASKEDLNTNISSRNIKE